VLSKLLVCVLVTGCFATAQERRHVVLVNNQEDHDLNWRHAYTYSVCGTDKAAGAGEAIRVSIESLVPQTIRPMQDVYVVLKVENAGSLPVTLPIRGEAIQPDEAAISYRANYDVLAGIPAGATMLGWFELYGSALLRDSLITLEPGDSVIIEGEMHPRHWFAAETKATAHANLQLYTRDPSRTSSKNCVKQVSGSSLLVFYPGLQDSP
jgi:hypothetical protein